MSRIVFFDFDGVIVDTFSLCFKIVDSREYITEVEYRKRFEGNVFDATRKYKKPDTKLETFMNDYTPELMKCEPVKEITIAIKELSSKYKLVIISSTETGPIDSYLKMVGLRDCFAEILGCDVDTSKVNKINMSLKKCGVQATETVFVTDTLGDMREAEKCGVKCIAVAGGYHDEETLRRGNPLAIVKSGFELVNAVESHFKN